MIPRILTMIPGLGRSEVVIKFTQIFQHNLIIIIYTTMKYHYYIPLL